MTTTPLADIPAAPTPAAIAGRRSIRMLAGARFASTAGSQAAQVALAFLVYERTSSAAWVSASLVASAGVVGLVGPLSGRLSDRLDRRRLMVVAEVGGAIGWLAVLLADVPITHHWGGPIDRTENGQMLFGDLGGNDRILYGVGYSGNGVGPSTSDSTVRQCASAASRSCAANQCR